MAKLTDPALSYFEAHHGVASFAQLTDLGLTPHAIRRLRSDGLLVDVLRGVYHLRGQPLTLAGRCVAMCAAHSGHFIAGPTAAKLWGFRKVGATVMIHTISPAGSHPTIAPWVKAYRTAAIDPVRDVVRRTDGISLTSRARTALDLSRWLDDTDLLSVIEQAAHDGQLSPTELLDVAIEWRSPQRSWLERFLRLVDQRLEGGAGESHPEVALGAALRAAGLIGLVRQHHQQLPGFGRARFDLAVPRLRWAIEVDVFPTHRESAGRLNDTRRDSAAAAIGWVTTRLDPDCFGSSFDATVQRLTAMYESLVAASGPSDLVVR